MAEMKKIRSELLKHPHISDEIKAFNMELEGMRKEKELELGKRLHPKLKTWKKSNGRK